MSRVTTYSLTQADEFDDRVSRTGIDVSTATMSVSLSSTGRSDRSRGQSRVVATALHNLEKKCRSLKPYSSFKKTELPEDAFNIFVEVSELASRVGGTPQYEDYLRITSSVFSDQMPGDGDTVADFFLGCVSSRPKSGSRIGCEARCAGNLPLENYDVNDFCDTHVGLYSGKTLSVTYSPTDRSDTIRIYHACRYVTLSTTEINKLRKMGVSNAILIYTGGAVPVSSMVPLYSLSQRVGPKKGGVPSRPQASMASRKERQQEGNSGMTGAGWAIGAVIFFILLVIIICVLVYGLRGDPAYQESCAQTCVSDDAAYGNGMHNIDAGNLVKGY